MSKKLQNIDAVNKMLAGEHKFQTNKTYGFSESKKIQKHVLLVKYGKIQIQSLALLINSNKKTDM